MRQEKEKKEEEEEGGGLKREELRMSTRAREEGRERGAVFPVSYFN